MESKLNIVLDLDNTLVCAVDNYINQNIEVAKNLRYVDYYINEQEMYRIYERPHLQEFLDFLFKHYNVSVFTNATGEYENLFVIIL